MVCHCTDDLSCTSAEHEKAIITLMAKVEWLMTMMDKVDRFLLMMQNFFAFFANFNTSPP